MQFILNPLRSVSTATLIVIGAAVCTLLVLAVVLWDNGDSEQPDIGISIYGEDAEAILADPGEVTIEDGQETTTLLRQDGLWGVAQKDGFPAAQDRVESFLDKLRNPQVLRKVDASGLNQLGVGEDDGDWNQRITTRGRDGERAFEIVVGGERSTPDSSDLVAVHVRAANSRDVWLIDTDLRVSAAPLDWPNRILFKIPREEIYEIRTAPTGNEPLIFRRDPPTAVNITAVNVSTDARHADAAALIEPIAVFTPLEFEDVEASASPPSSRDNAGLVRTLDGTRLDFWLEEEDGEVWARFAATQTEPVDVPEEDGDAVRAKGIEVAPNVNLSNWRFRLADYVAERLLRSVADIPNASPESDSDPAGE